MNKTIRISGLLLALIAAGCSSSRDEQTQAGSTPQMRRDAAAFAVADDSGERSARRFDATARFANLPDRGELIGYARGATTLREGPRSWHRIGISEAHARAAVASGRLVLSTPSGQLLDYRFEQQVAHESGDWTWIGHAIGGREQDHAVITFGANAVFGSIAVPGQEPLRLTMRDGAAWAVETDRAALVAAERAAAAPSRPDYLVPPVGAAASTEPVDEPMRLVDVVMGYTSLSPRSTVMTELNGLISQANSTLAWSGVKARLRLVGAVYIDYSANDASDQVTLEKLTGTSSVAVDPAFNPLRAAREQFGGDLVVLVREFVSGRTPGCGASWLLGANLRGIDASDAAYGYSVIKSRNSECSNMQFLHQLGHNFGAQHDIATASASGSVEYGAYPYAFGLRGSNFSTIMAFPRTGNMRDNFSNPRMECAEQSSPSELCGNADANNSRAIQQSIPRVSQFRRKVVPGGTVRYDTDGDGAADLFWRNKSGQMFAYWSQMAGGQSSPAFSMVSAYDIAGIADFTGDGRADVLWKSDADHYLVLWAAGENGFEQREIGGYEPGMSFVGIGDFNGDGRFDLLWRNYTTGQMKVWAMQSHRIIAQATASMPGWFDTLGVGDFNGDGYSDVVYGDSATLYLYSNNANNTMAFNGLTIGGRPGGWKYIGSVDYNGDGRDDMFWTSPAGDKLSYWLMDGTRIVSNPTRNVAGRVLIGPSRDVDSNQAEWVWDEVANKQITQDVLLGDISVVYSQSYPQGWQAVPMR